MVVGGVKGSCRVGEGLESLKVLKGEKRVQVSRNHRDKQLTGVYLIWAIRGVECLKISFST